MKDNATIATALALITLIQGAGPSPTTPTASVGQRGKAKSRPAPGTTGYGPVLKEHLLRDRTWCAIGRFRLTLTEEHFEIKGDKRPIPREVLEAFLGSGRKADKIEGRWDLAAGMLTFTKIRANGESGLKGLTLRPFRTGPSIIRLVVGGTQYVLIPNPRSGSPSGRE